MNQPVQNTTFGGLGFALACNDQGCEGIAQPNLRSLFVGCVATTHHARLAMVEDGALKHHTLRGEEYVFSYESWVEGG
jgi:hypothetical protein